MKVTGKSKVLGVIGDPISHSFSPELHNFISEYLNNDYIYSAYHVLPENLGKAIDGMRAMNIRGINVTSPHKIEVMKFLDKISEDAQLLGSVNTVVNDNGVLSGYNTDGDGFYMSLEYDGISVKDKDILILGCGGVVKPIILRLIKESPRSITLVNRTQEKAEKLADEISRTMGFYVKTTVQNKAYDIIINTTTAGMEHQPDILPWDSIEQLKGIDIINENSSAVDLIYNPACTKFMKYAIDKGAKAINGLNMLICQGIIAYELFTGTKVPDEMLDMVRKEVFNV